MDAYRQFNEDEAISAAKAALARTFDEIALLSDIELLSRGNRRNLVLRAKAFIGDKAHSIIIKATRSADYARISPNLFATSGLAREWIARDLLKQSEWHRSSALLAGDTEHGLIVFEDFGSDLTSLDTPLLKGTAAEAERALTDYATSLGRLHVATIGCAQRHAAVLRSTFPAASIPSSVGADWLINSLPEIDGVRPPNEEIELVRSRLADPGPWLALVHGDSCPDNVLLKDGKARLIDFEFSAPGHMLLDATFWRIGFPTCWCAGTVPEDVADRIDAIYRQEVSVVLPEIADDRIFAAELAIISVARTFHSLRWLLEGALVKDSTWGTATRRSRILWYLEAARGACRKADILPGVCITMQIWLDHLVKCWPESNSLSLYPAFVGPAQSSA